MKKGQVFANIIYYLFTFFIGILIAIFLPFFYMIYGESISTIQNALDKGDYSQAISIVGGYYDDTYVFQQDFESGGGIVLFNAASLVSGVNEDGETVENMNIHKAYAGFVYGVKSSYSVTKEKDNLAKIVVTDLLSTEREYEILNSDTNDDGKNDTNATCSQNGFFYIDIDQDTYVSLSKITLIDKDGEVFQEITLNLDYSEAFFADVSDFVEEYNKDFNSEKLAEYDEILRGKSEHYKMSSSAAVKKRADKKSAVVVVVYFICIYFIGDSLLGKRYIIRFFKWVLVKVFKVKFKQKNGPKHNEVFGHDYFCKLTLSIDTESVNDFDGSVQVRFQNQDGEEFTYILLKERNYTDTQSIKAGNYVNLWVDLNEKYKTQNLPDTMEVEGYQKTITFKIINRED